MAEPYKIKTDILVPADKLNIEYTGFHPTRLIRALPDILKESLKVEGADVFDPVLKWDVSGDTVSFYGEWLAKYSFDKYSNAEFKIVMQGTQSAKDKNGKIKIAIKGSVKTEFPSTTFLHRSIKLIYNHVFYNTQRRGYIEAGKIMIDRIEDEIRSMLNLIKKGG